MTATEETSTVTDVGDVDRAPIRRARPGPPEWLALTAAVTPILIAVAGALGTSWAPEYDAAYFSTRSLDVLTTHHPFVGAWSTFSLMTGDAFNNLGSLQLLALAPFTKIDPFKGAAVGVGLANTLAVVATFLAARRLFGPRGVIAVMAATVLLQISFGRDAWIDARQQLALLLPFWAFCWLTVVVIRRDSGWLPLAWVASGSFVLQTHFSYAYTCLALVVLGTGGFLAVHRGQWGSAPVRRVLAGSIGLAVLLWAHPLWDQFFGTGNISAVAGHAAGDEPPGYAVAANILAESSLAPPFWWPGSVARFGPPWDDDPSVLAVVVLTLWCSALVLVLLATHRRARHVAAAATVGLVTLVATWITAARISGALAQNYFALWPVSLFAFVVVLAAVSGWPPVRAVRGDVAAVGLFAVALLGVPGGLAYPQWDLPAELTGSRARRVLGDAGDRLDALVGDGRLRDGEAIVVDQTIGRILVPDYYNVLSLFLERGVDVHFTAGAHDLLRFGSDRCENGAERWRLRINVGDPSTRLAASDVLLGRGGGLADAATAELSRLQRRFEAAFHDGAFDVDVEALDELGAAGERLGAIAADPDNAHPDLAAPLDQAVTAGLAEVPVGDERAYRRWHELTVAFFATRWQVVMSPNETPEVTCAST